MVNLYNIIHKKVNVLQIIKCVYEIKSHKIAIQYCCYTQRAYNRGQLMHHESNNNDLNRITGFCALARHSIRLCQLRLGFIIETQYVLYFTTISTKRSEGAFICGSAFFLRFLKNKSLLNRSCDLLSGSIEGIQ